MKLEVIGEGVPPPSWFEGNIFRVAILTGGWEMIQRWTGSAWVRSRGVTFGDLFDSVPLTSAERAAEGLDRPTQNLNGR